MDDFEDYVAVDLDGTLSEHIWPTQGIGLPIEKTVEYMKHIRERGYKLCVYTSRGWTEYKSIKTWLEAYNVPYDRIECSKFLALAYIDDKAERPEWVEDRRYK